VVVVTLGLCRPPPPGAAPHLVAVGAAVTVGVAALINHKHPPNLRPVSYDCCFNCKYYDQGQTIELAYCVKYRIDVTYGFQNICDDFVSETGIEVKNPECPLCMGLHSERCPRCRGNK